MDMVEVRNLSKYYGEVSVIDDLSFSIKKGTILGFIGPNGAGKTTTMRMLSGFMSQSSGTVIIDGLDIGQHPLEVKKLTGYLPEHPPLYYDMRVDEYLFYVAMLQGVLPDMVPQRMQMVMDRCSLHEVQHKLIGALSKGYRQRVGIAQSLINDPEFLILDEPTVGLDPKQIQEIRTLIKSLAGERTVILSTHILSEVTLICDDILIINRGKMMLKQPLSELGNRPDLEKLFLRYTYELEEGS